MEESGKNFLTGNKTIYTGGRIFVLRGILHIEYKR
jgi:hypothetical protein